MLNEYILKCKNTKEYFLRIATMVLDELNSEFETCFNVIEYHADREKREIRILFDGDLFEIMKDYRYHLSYKDENIFDIEMRPLEKI